MTGALAWRGACVAGSGWRDAGMAKHAGQVARAERSAGCCGMRKVWRGEAASRRALVEKEGGGVRARGLGGGWKAGVEASGQGGEACWWRAACGVAGGEAQVEKRARNE